MRLKETSAQWKHAKKKKEKRKGKSAQISGAKYILKNKYGFYIYSNI